MFIKVALLDVAAAPVYQRIARKALHLQQLGPSRSAISKMLTVTDKAVAKAIVWLGQKPQVYKR